ncbi:substrate-binding domain-containing protein, partial [Desulfothermus okinawensis]
MSILFTTKEVANYLKINEKKVYQLVKEGAIPATRVAGKWLFPKEMIDQWLKRSVKTKQDIYIAGSNDPFLSYLISIFTKKYFPDILIFYASIGSAKGLISLSSNKATIAATHLFEPKSGKYNLPFIKKYLNDTPVVVVNLAYREQGFLVRKGNPFQIKEVKDLTKQNVRFINRNQGSGTRLLFDYLMQKSQVKSSSIIGYDTELNTHLDVGLYVYSG